jgi:hypothetical protein
MSLIPTTRGANGGSFVTVPSLDHISEFLSANISLLSQSEHVSLDEFLEARESPLSATYVREGVAVCGARHQRGASR